jgi:hypothetical protein
MRRDVMLAIGLAAVMVSTASVAAHRGGVFGAGFGPSVPPFLAAPRSQAVVAFGTPVHPFFVRPRNHLIFSVGVGTPVPPVMVRPPVLVAPPVIVTPWKLVAPPVIVTAPPARIVPRAVIVITPRRF